MNQNFKNFLTYGTYAIIAIGGIVLSTITATPVFGVLGTITGTSGILVHSTISVENGQEKKQETKKIIIEELTPKKETNSNLMVDYTNSNLIKENNSTLKSDISLEK